MVDKPHYTGMDQKILFQVPPQLAKFDAPQKGPLTPMESCLFKAVLSGVLGGGMGFAMGAVFGAHNSDYMMNPRWEFMTSRQQLWLSWNAMRGQARGMAKTFGGIGLMLVAMECVVEKELGTMDYRVPILSGFTGGAVMSASGGPGAAITGGLGFAFFSAGMHWYMHS